MTQDMISRRATVPPEAVGRRIDQVAAELLPEFSRSQLQTWLKRGQMTVDGRECRPRDKVAGGESLALEAVLEPQGEWRPQAIPLTVLHEDEHLLVIDKPAGLVVHPGAGNPDETLVNALLHRFPELENLPRAGIVHRLDKDTSGLMVVARTLQARHVLVNQLQARSVSREYEAVVQGVPTGGAIIDAPIGRHPRARTRMAVVPRGGRAAVTRFRLLRRFPHHAHVRVSLETGRTHQIRVHMAHIGYPLVGDPVYGGRLRLPPGASDSLVQVLRQFRRQALHAAALSLIHPASGESVSWTSPLPEDFRTLLDALEAG